MRHLRSRCSRWAVATGMRISPGKSRRMRRHCRRSAGKRMLRPNQQPPEDSPPAKETQSRMARSERNWEGRLFVVPLRSSRTEIDDSILALTDVAPQDRLTEFVDNGAQDFAWDKEMASTHWRKAFPVGRLRPARDGLLLQSATARMRHPCHLAGPARLPGVYPPARLESSRRQIPARRKAYR